MPIVHHDDVPREMFRAGITYQTLVGDSVDQLRSGWEYKTSAPWI